MPHQMRRRPSAARTAEARRVTDVYEVRKLIADVMCPRQPILYHLISPDLPERRLHDPDVNRIVRRCGGTVTVYGGPLTAAGDRRVRQWRQEWLSPPRRRPRWSSTRTVTSCRSGRAGRPAHGRRPLALTGSPGARRRRCGLGSLPAIVKRGSWMRTSPARLETLVRGSPGRAADVPGIEEAAVRLRETMDERGRRRGSGQFPARLSGARPR